MYHLATKMKLFRGFEAEYKKRHQEIWPELAALLKDSGVDSYHIFLDEETNILFSILRTEDPSKLDLLPSHPIMQRWWLYMRDIMETNEDNSPVNIPLTGVFDLNGSD